MTWKAPFLTSLHKQKQTKTIPVRVTNSIPPLNDTAVFPDLPLAAFITVKDTFAQPQLYTITINPTKHTLAIDYQTKTRYWEVTKNINLILEILHLKENVKLHTLN